ncbi:MAG: sigma-70 family RNA polymerase sigma factor [Bacteroidetes bacterium]|nr:sigma-70 family RNA polymerase sigma factor [Bacteroidota bacterium]
MKHTTHHSQLSDEELLRRFRADGDNIWLGHLLQRHTLLLLGIAMKYLGDKDAAADAVQQIFLKTLSQLPKEPINNFKGWLYIIMRNHCLQQLRDRVRVIDGSVLENTASEDVANLEETKLREISIEEMEAALHSLATEQRICITAFYLQRKSYTEIMEQYGYSFAQVKSYIQNGKRNLRIILCSLPKNASR